METTIFTFSINSEMKVPTRLEGMETKGNDGHERIQRLLVPTRLEGMETLLAVHVRMD